MTVIASQTFDSLSSSGTFTDDSLPSGSALTNAGASSDGGAGIGFRTFWFDTRGETTGPAVGSESGDFIGVNSFGGSNAPDVSADGTAVAEGREHNFEFNDGDGRLDLVLEPVDVSGFADRQLGLTYWINDTGYEADDRFTVTVGDGTTIFTVLDYGDAELETNASPDTATTSWNTLTVDLEPLIAAGLDPTRVALTIGADTNSGSENIFVDTVLFESLPPSPGTFSIGDAVAVEGDAGTGEIAFTVTRSDDSAGAATLDYAVSFTGGADAGDFDGAAAFSGQVSFADGETDRTITLPVLGDTAVEPDETFTVTLSNPSAGTIADGSATGTIVDDDGIAINEIRIDQGGGDSDEYVEISGPAGASLDGLSYVVIGDGTGGSGVVEEVVDLSGATIGPDGNFLVASGDFRIGVGEVDLVADLNFENSDNVTHLLVADFTGAPGDDLDTDDDGTFDTVPWSEVVDGVALVESFGSGDAIYSETTVGPDGSFVPGHVYRSPDGGGAFQVGPFNPAGLVDTPGFENDAAPVAATPTPIHEIQGRGHLSPLAGQTVLTGGIVTAVSGTGFFLQDPDGDGDDATSDAIFVDDFGTSVQVGDLLTVEGRVVEWTPGGLDTGNLSTTRLVARTIETEATGQALPEAVVLGEDRTPPTETIEDDDFASYDPASDGIDFWESLEGMRVAVEDAVAVAPTNRFGEVYTALGEPGALTATNLSERGTLNIDGGEGFLGVTNTGAGADFNPERVQIDDDLLRGVTGGVDVGAGIGGVVGVLDYNFGNYEIQATEAFTKGTSDLAPETTALVGSADQLTVASYNVLNLDPNDADGDADVADGRFTAIAEDIATGLGSPDVIALQEIQDASGSFDDGTVSAEATLQLLVDEIEAASGVRYAFIDNPFIEDGASGGQPGGNIRNAFLYRTDRVELVEGSVTSIAFEDQATNPENPFFDARLPLVATFAFAGEEVTLVNTHFSSKGGSTPLFGAEQPPINGSAEQRAAQAAAVNAFVDGLLAENPLAKVVVAGDLNEFEFEEPMQVLEGDLALTSYDVPGSGPDDATATVADSDDVVLTNLSFELEEEERYTFIFDGNSQSLDHILVTDALRSRAEFDIVHLNTEFANQASDHDPVLARFTFDGATEIAGTDGTETLSGSRGADLILGLAGDDRVAGGQGDDTAIGGAGDDTLIGNTGDDVLLGGSGNDRLLGNAGDDTLDGGTGDDWLAGGAGADTYVFDFEESQGFGDDVVLFDAAADTLVLKNADLSEEEVADTLEAASGQVVLDFGDSGSITLYGFGVASAFAADDIVFA